MERKQVEVGVSNFCSVMCNLELFGLFIDCPLSKRVKDCPFLEFENLALEKKIEIIEKLDSNKKEQLILHHQSCLYKREKNTDS